MLQEKLERLKAYLQDLGSVAVAFSGGVDSTFLLKVVHDENYRKARKEFLVGYDRSVPKLRQANHCTGCNQCSPKCPQGLNIPEELRKIDAYVESLKRVGG